MEQKMEIRNLEFEVRADQNDPLARGPKARDYPAVFRFQPIRRAVRIVKTRFDR